MHISSIFRRSYVELFWKHMFHSIFFNLTFFNRLLFVTLSSYIVGNGILQEDKLQVSC